MGKGPNSIYKDCVALARKRDKELSVKPNENDIQVIVNRKFNCVSLFERDVRLAFFEQNYSEKATNRALDQWVSLEIANRIVKNGYKLFVFLDWATAIQEAA